MPLLYSATIFLSAFLLFQVQPMIGRFILPWFGSAPGVWAACMLFFQTTLLLGYAYAHYVVNRFSPRRQAIMHVTLLALAVLVLPITPDASLKPPDGDSPVLRITGILAFSVGVPYLLLSATGPLMQAWFAREFAGRSPYRLYALSNVGSLAALLSFPFLFEQLKVQFYLDAGPNVLLQEVWGKSVQFNSEISELFYISLSPRVCLFEGVGVVRKPVLLNLFGGQRTVLAFD